MAVEFYSLKAKTPSGELIDFNDFRGKTVLVVNTATKCGFAPHFRGLEELHRKYRERGLTVIGFPCNQFQNQEPVKNEDMVKTCAINFGVTFQLTEKIKVNGPETHDVFAWLKDKLPGRLGKRIKWNFTKFLITPKGEAYRRYAPSIKPARIEQDILNILDQGRHSV